jgi:hypothetical protein
MTRRLEQEFTAKQWSKESFNTTLEVRRKSKPDIAQTSTGNTHELDHFRAFDGRRRGLALEIEWNTKDTFYDRDLGNFQKLHSLGIISVGIIVTRSTPLQNKLQELFVQEYIRNPRRALNWLGRRPTWMKKAIAQIPDRKKRLERIAQSAFSSKYGASTTHWGKLQEHLDRGMGAPCPLVLIGIGADQLVTN